MRRVRRRVRIKDIAEQLGVNPATVSRALNPSTQGMISRDQVERIKNAAHELGYIPNLSAAALRTDRTHTIGVVVPDILNPVFPPIIKGIQDYLHQNGYLTLIVNSNNDQQVALEEVNKLITRQVDGFILANAFLKDLSVAECLRQEMPMVLVNRTIENNKLVHQVLSDDVYGLQLAIDHLLELGHRRLLHLAGPQDILHGKQRLQAFKDICTDKNIDHDYYQLSAFSIEQGREGAIRYCEEPGSATAILAGNDLIAIGCISELHKRGIHVPNDVSVIGFNNMPLADMLSPALTTIAIPHNEFGTQSARLILQVLETPGLSRQEVLLSPKLVVRDSTGPVKPSNE